MTGIVMIIAITVLRIALEIAWYAFLFVLFWAIGRFFLNDIFRDPRP